MVQKGRRGNSSYSTESSTNRASISKPTSSVASLRRRIQRRELQKLQRLVPASLLYNNRRRRQHPLAFDVIESAIRYIDHLHATVMARVNQGSLPTDVLRHVHLNLTTTTTKCTIGR